jgi:RNA polymerase sigma-70 factor (ECF subfamily)
MLAVRVRTALSNLPPDQHRMIQLAYFEGCSQSEIAALENVPLGTVKSRTRLGLRKLSELLRDERETGSSVVEEGRHS